MTLESLQREARRFGLDLSSMNVVKATAAAAAAAAAASPHSPLSPPSLASPGLLRVPSFCSAQGADDAASRARRHWHRTGGDAAEAVAAPATTTTMKGRAVAAPADESARHHPAGVAAGVAASVERLREKPAHGAQEAAAEVSPSAGTSPDQCLDRCDAFGETPHGRKAGGQARRPLGDPMDDWIETPSKDWWRSTGF
jgi:hypothetical protein